MAELDPFLQNESSTPEDDHPNPLVHLAAAIVEQRAIVFVGAGASVPSGGPLWSELLNWLCREGVRPLFTDESASWKYLNERLTEKKFLEAADLLQDILDNDLPRLLRKKFTNVSEPSSIHANIGRIPFTGAITSNYDDLLEMAYRNLVSQQERPYVLTWNNPHGILQAVQDNSRYVIKTHGKIDDGASLILSSRQYRDLVYANPLYWQILKWIFMTKTCFFVGCSLADPDLLQLFEEVITEAGETFGPHYALLTKDEAPPIKVDNLWRRLKVKVIRLTPPGGNPPKGSDKQVDKSVDKTWVEAAVSEELVDLAGEVAKQRVETRPPGLPTSDDRDFYLINALKRLLQSALEVTGSFRGDICLQEDGVGHRSSSQLYCKVQEGPTDPSLPTNPSKHIQHDPTSLKISTQRAVDRHSVCGIAYYESSPGKGIYMSDVGKRRFKKDPTKTKDANDAKSADDTKGADDSDLKHWGEINYVSGHSEVQSELALPIVADGVRVGVINLESCLKDAYGTGHVAATHWYAEKAGRLFATTLERNRRGRGLEPEVIRQVQSDFLIVAKNLWALSRTRKSDEVGKAETRRLEYLIFHANYIEGSLTAQEQIKPQEWAVREFGFDERPSLTSWVFRKRLGAYCSDAQVAMEDGLVSDKYKGYLGLSGPLISFPIYVQGCPAGVLFCWCRDGKKGDLDWQDMELLQRASHLIANAGSRDFALKPMYDVLLDEDKDESTKESKRRAALAKQRILGTQEVIELCITEPTLVQKKALQKENSNGPLFDAWVEVAQQVASLLELLWIRYGQFENDWLVPTRARLWVVDGSKHNTFALPLFGLVMEVSLKAKEDLSKARDLFLKKHESPRRHNGPETQATIYDDFRNHWNECAKGVEVRVSNLFGEKSIFLTAQPEPLHGQKEGNAKEKAQRADVKKRDSEGAGAISLDDFSPEAINQKAPYKCFKDPDMSFMLSRQWADRFARLQLPATKESDFSNLLGRDPGAPIYAAPILMMVPPQMKEVVVFEEELQRNPIGLLALDSTFEPSDSAEDPKTYEPPKEDSHITLQNELLHTVDLFAACLAAMPQFRNIGKHEADSGNLRSEVP